MSTKFLDSKGVSTLWKRVKEKIDEVNALDRVSELETKVQNLQDNAYDDTDLSNRVQANADAIAILNGTEDGSVSKTVATEIAKIVAGADEDFDTLKEIADWIASDETGAAELGNRVTALETTSQTHTTDITNLKALIDADKAAAWSAAEGNAKAYTDEQIATVSALSDEEILEAIANA